MKEKFIRFMQGRYGTDAFSKFLLLVTILLFVLSLFIKAHNIFYILGLMLLGYCYFRMFSRNISKRYQENMLYLKYQNKVMGKLKRFKSESAQRKTHHIYRCPQCRQKIRVPRGRGKIAIRCPKCNIEFIKKS